LPRWFSLSLRSPLPLLQSMTRLQIRPVWTLA
jgi:hypothetical protein